MKVKVFTVLTLALALFLSACGKSDADLTKAATDKLTADKVTGLTVTVKDGVASLSGEAADAAVRSKAEASVKTVEGIKSVDIAKVTLKPPPPPPAPAPDQMNEGIINEALKKAGITGVTVKIANGEVTLSGTVDKANVVKVMQIASEAKVGKVINNLNK